MNALDKAGCSVRKGSAILVLWVAGSSWLDCRCLENQEMVFEVIDLRYCRF